MNTKKTKNKQKQHKPPTPQPAADVSNVSAEKPEQANVQEKSEIIKCEERVPEIVSEVVQPMLEPKVSESDAPKKPKRNRGKKKKNDKGEETDEIPEMPVSVASKITGEIQEIKDSRSTDENQTESSEITPAARNKKNKNKKQSEQAEKQSEQEAKIVPVKKDEDITDIKIITVVPVATETSEESKSKKKNKKKKRNDSERSEKAEEIVSCTAAFQKLLEPRDDKKDVKKETKAEDVKQEIPSKIAEQSKTIKELEVGTEKQSLKPETAPRDKSTENKNQLKEEGGKGKKKNKKDKKQMPKEESEDEAVKPLQTKTEIDSEGQTVTVPTDIRIEKEVSREETKVTRTDFEKSMAEQVSFIEKEKSPKPKAKIAKPVEKKRKNTQEVSSTENLSAKVIENISMEEKSPAEPAKNITFEDKPSIEQPVNVPEQGQETKSIDDGIKKPQEIAHAMEIPEPVETKSEITSKSTEKTTETDKIQLPESGSSKKRNKSPKLKPFTDQPTSVTEPSDIQIDEKQGSSLLQESKKEEEIIQKGDKKLEPKPEPEPKIEALKESQPLPLSFEISQEPAQRTKSNAPGIPKDQTITQPSTTTSIEIEAHFEKEKENIQVPEASGRKNRKKSPKQQKKPEKPIERQPIPLGFEISHEPKQTTITPEITKEQIITQPSTIISIEIEAPVEKQKEKENIQVPEASGRKNIKKSPKPPNKPEKQIEPIEASVALKESQPIPLGFEISHEPTQTTIVPEIAKEQIITQPSTTTSTEIKVTVEKQKEKENIQVPEASGRKNRKKSPKPQNKPEKPTEPIEHPVLSTLIPKQQEESKTTEQSTSTTESMQETPKEPLKTKTDSLSDMPLLEDIEIRSVKADESEGSVCDITPDIHYPRASSQLQDNNNNTVIRDITSSDVKLHIPNILSDAPIIQGSGETPLPETADSGVTITEINMPEVEQEDNAFALNTIEKETKPEEKTDLKSKVLDVNQGMEELRRSIERSLAELSSMEKSEKEAEDQFFKAQAKLELITEMASKKSEEKKQGTSTEKIKQIQEKTPEAQKTHKEKAVLGENKFDETKTSPKTENIIDKPTFCPVPNVLEEIKTEQAKMTETSPETEVRTQTPPVPARKDNKGKGKRKKGKQEFETLPATSTAPAASGNSGSGTTSCTNESAQDTKKEEKTEQKTDKATQEKGKQQSASHDDISANYDTKESSLTDSVQMGFERIETFEDALYTNVDENEQDINKTFEMIANEANKCDESQNPEINITAPIEDEEDPNDKKENEKVNPLSQPKNLLGHPDIPARLNRTDYKKEKNKHQTPNTKQATVKIKDAVPIEVTKESKESQTENKRRFLKDKTVTESITSMISENEEYIYKYSFRKVFLPSACHVCKKDLKLTRVPCNFCNLIFYCSIKHKDEDYQQHQSLCFAVSTIVHLRDQKHIYADTKHITGHEYRLLRMQMIVSCEKVLKRRLVPWEQEALLYPRICADVRCREWRQNKLVDCEGCGQIAYCSNDPTHLPKTHQRWCKSYSLYNKLVVYQQTRGRLEPRLPTRVMAEVYQIPEKLNEVLASMYEEKIDMTDIQYAALTQIATAPLTAAYCHQLYNNKMNAIYANGAVKKSSFTIHVVGAELQFEADALNKWEIFFLHLRPDVKDLRVVLVGPNLNPSKLPLDLLSKIKLCENCRQNKRRVLFDFQDKKTYYEYWSSDFTTPDLVCAFNPSIQRSSVFNGKDTWPSTIKCILKLKVPFVVTSYTMSELQKDLNRIKECSDVEVKTISEAEYNAFASVRPDRNFISDDEMPLLFKNFCFSTVCGAF